MIIEVLKPCTSKSKECTGKYDKKREVIALLEADRIVDLPHILDEDLTET